MLEAKEIAAMRARCERATLAPWNTDGEDRNSSAEPTFIKTGTGSIRLMGATSADQEFIAHARQDVPVLIAEVERLVELIFQRQKLLRVYADFNDGDDDGYWILYYRHKPLAEQIAELGLKTGDMVILYQDEGDFEVTAKLDRKRIYGDSETWVAVPDWSTLVRKLSD